MKIRLINPVQLNNYWIRRDVQRHNYKSVKLCCHKVPSENFSTAFICLCSWLYIVIHGYTWLYMAIHGYT